MGLKETKIHQKIFLLHNKLTNLYRNRFYRFGVPFLLFVVGGSFGLKEWTQIRYEFSQVKGVSKEEAKKMGLDKTRDVTLESVYEDIQQLDIDNWENKRGPRPWETNQTKK
ncbi:hypothetical protein ACJJTC_017962 [Scirpophaga incertulas]